MKIRTFLILSILLFFPTLSSAGEGHAHGPDGSHISDDFHTAGAGDVVQLSTEAESNLDIKTALVESEPLAKTRTLFGRVTGDPRRVSLISAPFQGKVEELYVLPGTRVSKGTKLLRVRPIQLGSKAKILRAATDGYITELNAKIGMVFEATDSLVTVSDLRVVLFEGDLFDSSALEGVSESTGCSVHTKRFPKRHFSCAIETVDSVFQGNPPVGHVHARVENTEAELKPGMSGKIHITTGESVPRITIPAHTVLGRFERTFVYRKLDGKYLKTPVSLGEAFGDNVEVKEGLKHGDTVVTQGHYQLQFAKSEELEKQAHADKHDHEDHSHNHDDVSENGEHPQEDGEHAHTGHSETQQHDEGIDSHGNDHQGYAHKGHDHDEHEHDHHH